MHEDGHELAVERLMDVPREAVWRAYTQHLPEWFCPRPWTTEIVEVDLRPGGRSALILRGPNGEGGDVLEGVYLDVVPGEKVVFTDAFSVGWVPKKPFMLGFFTFADAGDGKTLYRAGARHWDAETKAQHETMGFMDGWAKVAEQLEEVAKGLAAPGRD
ncbi:SRPBCC domain-containing protein [Sphingomonas sp.]|uniref:SRPBCC domain-containing protein n=1 Tax=Sphingomonas sp. TaxID=28214 RepID=UPI001B0FEB5B|nr:SRPBCC domain-containing protein [Sphingomonas sp.]MBO9713346.1 SRPBCC domain-containing protein [Sphingomonas sp.]